MPAKVTSALFRLPASPIREGVTRRYGPKATSQYRWLPPDLFGTISYAVYGNKYCLAMLGKKMRMVVIEHAGVAAVHRQQFEAHWKMARHVPFTRPLFEEDREEWEKKRDSHGPNSTNRPSSRQ